MWRGTCPSYCQARASSPGAEREETVEKRIKIRLEEDAVDRCLQSADREARHPHRPGQVSQSAPPIRPQVRRPTSARFCDAGGNFDVAASFVERLGLHIGNCQFHALSHGAAAQGWDVSSAADARKLACVLRAVPSQPQVRRPAGLGELRVGGVLIAWRCLEVIGHRPRASD